MKTRRMLELLKTAGYPLSLVAAQADVSYMKTHRYLKGTHPLTYDEKARLWRFGKAQPVVEDALGIEIEEENE